AFVIREQGRERASGEVVGEARGLQQRAALGDVLLSEAVRAAVGQGLELEPDTDAGSWRLVGVSEDATPISRRFEQPLVGREHELEELRRAFARARRERSCVLCTVLGPAGIGKSR